MLQMVATIRDDYYEFSFQIVQYVPDEDYGYELVRNELNKLHELCWLEDIEFF